MTIDNLTVSGKGNLLGSSRETISREKLKVRTIKSTEPAPKLTATLKELQMSMMGVQTLV